MYAHADYCHQNLTRARAGILTFFFHSFEKVQRREIVYVCHKSGRVDQQKGNNWTTESTYPAYRHSRFRHQTQANSECSSPQLALKS